MLRFSRNTSVAIVWRSNGQCTAIRLHRTGASCRVETIWNAKTDASHTLQERLSEGLIACKAEESAALLASCATGGWSFADISLPNLPPDQFSNALAFEIRKHTPIPPEKLIWGYRELTPATARTPGHYRVFFLRQDIWKEWCDTLRPFGKFDAILPAPLALDPLFSGSAASFVEDDGHVACYASEGNSPSSRVYTTLPNESPKTLAEMLPLEEIALDLGELNSLDIATQTQFADALTLALYGLTDAAITDAATLPKLPDAMRRRHSRALLYSAVAMLVVTLIAFFLTAIMHLQANLSQRRQLNDALAEITQQATSKRGEIKRARLTRLNELKKEISETISNTSLFPLALNDISRIIAYDRPHNPWISSRLTWTLDSNSMKFTLEEAFDDASQRAYIDQTELLDALNASPFILDARGNNANIVRNANKRTRDFTLQLGWKDKTAEKRTE